jgi:uncharacterized protein (DUF2267 family)
MNHETFLDRVLERAALSSRDEARAVSGAVMQALGELLDDRDRLRLAGVLSAPLAEALRRGRPGQTFDRDELYRRVQQREGVAPGFGIEHVQVVCRTLAEMLGDAPTVYLVRRLPDSFAPLFERRRPSPRPDRARFSAPRH